MSSGQWLEQRESTIQWKPGYDGVYGVPLFEDAPHEEKKIAIKQTDLANW